MGSRKIFASFISDIISSNLRLSAAHSRPRPPRHTRFAGACSYNITISQSVSQTHRHRHRHRHTHTHGPLSGTTRVSRCQKGKTNLYFTEARDSEWQWHQLGHMQVCTSLQRDNPASTPPLSFLQA